uniref:Uncharacterized protein n=1 Tax=Arundo donax TaxID=35708 RepID=A0A0A9GKD6_ARUDO
MIMLDRLFQSFTIISERLLCGNLE